MVTDRHRYRRGDGWSTTWDTATAADGSHTLEATATDDAQQVDTDSITVMVEDSPTGSKEILMVVGDATTLTAGDTAVRNRLTASCEVTVGDDNAASLPDASQHDLGHRHRVDLLAPLTRTLPT